MLRIRNPWADPRVIDVKPRQARQYILSHGWVEVPTSRDWVWTFEGPRDKFGAPMRVSVPRRKGGEDYDWAISEMIGFLANIERRHALPILEEMLALPATAPHVNGTARPARKRQAKETAG